jgi:hypothetical protein
MSAEKSKPDVREDLDREKSELVIWYLYVYNICQLASWVYISYFLKEALLQLMDISFMPAGSFGPDPNDPNPMPLTEAGIAGELAAQTFHILLVNHALAWLELVHAMCGWTSSRPYAVIYQTGLRSAHTFICLKFSVNFMNSRGYVLLMFAWTFGELIRYNFYILTSMTTQSSLFGRVIKMLRYNAFIVLYPIGGVAEFLLDWDFLSGNLTSWPQNTVWWGLVVMYVLLFPGLFKNMWVQRQKYYRGLRHTELEAGGPEGKKLK